MVKLLVVGDLHGKVLQKLKKKISQVDFDLVIGIGDYSGIDDWRPWIKYVFGLKKGEERKSPEEFFGKKKFKELIKKDYDAGEKVLKYLDSLGKPGFYVFGNGDEGWYRYPFSSKILQAEKRPLKFLSKLKNLKDINYGIRRLKGVSILGFGGYIDAPANKKSRDKEWQAAVDKRHNKARKKMVTLSRKFESGGIFILHYPPKGIFDKILEKGNPYRGGRVGVDFYRETILKKKPSLVLCGHMHEYVGKKKLGKSLVVNPGEGAKGKFAIVDFDEVKKKVRRVDFY